MSSATSPSVDCTHWRDTGSPYGGRCAIGQFGGAVSFGVCNRLCRVRAPLPAEARATLTVAGQSSAPWPLAARLVSRLRHPVDRGVGDTLARTFNVIPAYRGMGLGDAFKAFMKAIGRDCGCGDRQAKLNEFYPYDHIR